MNVHSVISMMVFVAAGFNSALVVFILRPKVWFGSNFALCCFGQSFTDPNCCLTFEFAFLRTFLFFYAFAIFLYTCAKFCCIQSVSSCVD